MAQKNLFKKGFSILLGTAITISGITADGYGNVVTAQAETGSGMQPDVTKFATREQLKDGNLFALYNDGDHTDAIAQKVYFGKKNQTDKQTWYIAGYDGNGLVLMCDPKNPLADKQQFLSDDKLRYEDTTKTWFNNDLYNDQTVYANHYGASDLRKCLQGLETNTDIFTSDEQKLMKSTTIYTYDTYNRTSYSTADRLYAVYGEFLEEYITVGKNDSNDLNGGIKVGLSSENATSASPYNDPNNSRFWLRAPMKSMDGLAGLIVRAYENAQKVSNLDGYVGDISGIPGVVPAFDLDSDSVLFASAASAADISANFADTMTFRLNAESGGTDEILSTAFYDTDSVTVEKDNSDTDLYLYVQGKDGDSNWVYSTQVNSNGQNTFDLSEIHNGADLTQCRIWLETTDTDENLTYAKMAEISLAAITDIAPPEGGKPFDADAMCAVVGIATAEQTVSYIEKNTTTTVTGNAKFNTTYTASVTLTPDTGYVFKEDISVNDVTVNGNKAETVTLNANGQLTVTYDFEVPMAKLMGITAPDPIHVRSGTDKTAEAFGLPAEVTIETEDLDVISADVTWDLDNLANGTYDPTNKGEQEFTVNGAVMLPNGIDQNGISLTTTIQVTVDAAGTAGAPTAAPSGGTYTNNQKVTLSTSTNEAEIYYIMTVDGTDPDEPTAQTGIKYTEPIAVEGTPGTSVTVKIKAIAVGDNLYDSSVSAFEYVIDLAAPAIITQPPVTPDTAEDMVSINHKAKVSVSGAKLKIAWSRVDGADGYDIYAEKCGSNLKLMKTVKDGAKTRFVIRKIGKQKISEKGCYKVKIHAYRIAGGKKEILAKTLTYHAAGKDNKKYTNAKSMKLSQTTLAIKEGGTQKIKAQIKKQDKKKRLLLKRHVSTYRYYSTDKNIASVSYNGIIKGNQKGSCTVYAVAANGVKKGIKVTVN